MNVNTNTEIIPKGLIQAYYPRLTIENTELRAALEKAVEDAELNVTERMAINKTFYPNGGGFELFPKDTNVTPAFIYYKNKKDTKNDDYFIKQADMPDDLKPAFSEDDEDISDSFTKEVNSIKIPEDVSRIKTSYINSSKSNYQSNLDNALKKLKKVLKDNI